MLYSRKAKWNKPLMCRLAAIYILYWIYIRCKLYLMPAARCWCIIVLLSFLSSFWYYFGITYKRLKALAVYRSIRHTEPTSASNENRTLFVQLFKSCKDLLMDMYNIRYIYGIACIIIKWLARESDFVQYAAAVEKHNHTCRRSYLFILFLLLFDYSQSAG